MTAAAPAPSQSPDPGLQPQRTTLAWNRTALAVLVNALLMLRLGEQSNQRATTLLGIILLVAAAAVTASGWWRRKVLQRDATPQAPPAWLLAALVALVCLACVAGGVSILAAARA
jgi:uncharacterized membrane protein YidH (DUF202 family)